MFLCSSSSHSKRFQNAIATGKNHTEEDEAIYLDISSRNKDRILNTIIYLADETSSTPVDTRFTICEMNAMLMKRFDRSTPEYETFTNSVKTLSDYVQLQMYHYGPSLLYAFILYGLVIERPEKIDLINAILDLNSHIINYDDWQRRNILHRLVRLDFSSRPYRQVAELLIKRGIYMNRTNKDNETPLECAVVHKNLDMLLLLLRNGGPRIFNHNQNIAHFALVNGRISCLHAIIKFFLVRKIQGKEVDENIMNLITTEEISEHYKICLEDLESLKANIVNSNVSVYDILYKPKQNVVKYLRNENIILEIKRIILRKTVLSYFFTEIRDTALVRRDLEDSSLITLKKKFKLPESCIEKIISYLDNDNLKNVSAL
ncbi:uncharacterized protein LOC123671666 isoform X2 [Harmonia axyridis]|uniref:uncharacterized protein LOC123671666 isoform X2 n=1 Tax=Harmonia axyridis TaxID=115357 RepID=UPI001E275C08|nr:uncharacterized protein LOC123671666 isoform X2 [Harmonia axyridis]